MPGIFRSAFMPFITPGRNSILFSQPSNLPRYCLLPVSLIIVQSLSMPTSAAIQSLHLLAKHAPRLGLVRFDSRLIKRIDVHEMAKIAHFHHLHLQELAYGAGGTVGQQYFCKGALSRPVSFDYASIKSVRHLRKRFSLYVPGKACAS